MDQRRKKIGDAVVSDERERLILVDDRDTPIGFASKAACHDEDGVLHRAFSLFLVNGEGHVLMQQRSLQKRLWPRYWSNSCCSHPRAGETMEEAIDRRLAEELGITSRFTFLFKFIYHARYGSVGSEHEVCSVFLGRSDDTVRCNRNEIASWCFVAPATLTGLLSVHPQWFTPWFRMEWQRIMNDHRDSLESLADPRLVHAAESVRQET